MNEQAQDEKDEQNLDLKENTEWTKWTVHFHLNHFWLF